MPLDTGALTKELFTSAAISDGETIDQVQIHTPTLEAALNIGAAIRAAREHRGLSLQDVADATCVRRAYLEAIEEMRVEDLPARPFTIGYIRSVALELGLDPAAAVARFKQDVPERAEPLRAPSGVSHRKDNRLGLILGLGAVVLVTGIG
ncbi:MAG: helix-turn-helix domain-containing protein, partial [Caulobacteraceae bacterium]